MKERTDRLPHGPDAVVYHYAKELGVRSVCDLGCGVGRNLLHIEHKIGLEFAFGVDAEKHQSFRVANIAPPQPQKFVFTKGDWRKALEFVPPIPFDLCFSNNVLEHLTEEDGRHFVAASLRIGNGTALHVLPIEKNHWDERYHLTAWTMEDFHDLLARYGEIAEWGECGNRNMYGLVRC